MDVRVVARRGSCCLEALEGRVLLAALPPLDIEGVQPAALDQPRINALVRRSATGTPLMNDIAGMQGFNIEGFLGTGASGVLLGDETADGWGIVRSALGGNPVIFSKVGAGVTEAFDVSEPLYLSLAAFHPDTDVDNLDTYQTVYGQTFGALRTQIGAMPALANPMLAGLDVFGMPVMAGKVVVIDPKPLNTYDDTMRTYVYNPGTAYNAGAADTNPGIPTTSRHVKLSYASFDRFTSTAPVGAPGPGLRHNPFVGPNPVAPLDPNAPADPGAPGPGITIMQGARSSTGSWLLDTGASASMISVNQAQSLHVYYAPGTFGTANPRLVDDSGNSVPGQFTLSIPGIGGTFKAAGFFVDSLSVPTMEGQPIRFIHAPVLVADMTVKDPLTQTTLTLDGVLGMNYLVASGMVSEGAAPDVYNLSAGAFDWVVFDEPNGVLGLDVPGIDLSEPTASVTTLPVTTSGGTTYQFKVTYSDDAAMDPASVDDLDLRVTSTNGFNAAARFVDFDVAVPTPPKSTTAVYEIDAPGGNWDPSDSGTYSIIMQAAQVKDAAGNAVAGGLAGTFQVNLSNTAPTITSLTDGPDPVVSPASITLTAVASDSDGAVASVMFYRESNGNAGLQSGAGGDTLVGTSTSGPGGWTAGISTSSLAAGTYTYYAEATDNSGAMSAAGLLSASTTNTVQAPSSDIIVDNTAATLAGAWTTSTWNPGFHGSNYLHDNNTAKGTKSVTFAPALPSGGTYAVYARWTTATNSASNVPIDITSATGTATVIVNQLQNGGTWVLLGNWNFNSGSTGSVKIRTTGTNGYVIADAVKFTKVTVSPPLAPGNLKATAASSAQIGLTWNDNSSNESGFKLQRSTDASFASYQEIPLDPNTTSYNDGGLNPSTAYYYRLCSWNPAGPSSWTAPAATVTTLPASIPSEFIVDNSSAVLSGSWTTSTWNPGYYGSNYLHDGNTAKGTRTAQFTPNLASAGSYAVYARWTTATNSASNVPIDITSATGTATVIVNQLQNGGTWVLLGTWSLNSGTAGNVKIRTTGTNGYVIADGVKFVKVAAGEIVLDNSAAALSGSWTTSTWNPGYYGSNYLHDNNAAKGTRIATFSPVFAESGSYQVYARWVSAANYASNVPIDILDSAGSHMVSVNQRTNGGVWVLLGTYSFNSGSSGSVTIRTTGTDGYVVVDAVKFVKV